MGLNKPGAAPPMGGALPLDITSVNMGPGMTPGAFGGGMAPPVIEEIMRLMQAGIPPEQLIAMLGQGGQGMSAPPTKSNTVSSGSRSIRSGTGAGYPTLADSMGRR